MMRKGKSSRGILQRDASFFYLMKSVVLFQKYLINYFS